MKKLKIIIAGSRTIQYHHYNFLITSIKESNFNISKIICGEAKGADTLGKIYGIDNNIEILSFPANWCLYGKQAGILRNIEMSKVADGLIALWDGKSTGTKHMISIMAQLNKPIYIKEISEEKNLKDIIIYVDGACSNNPGIGGIGITLVSGEFRKEISIRYNHTTNNRMELLAVIHALEEIKLKRARINIYSDSEYVTNAINKNWLDSWVKNNWKNSQKKEVKNKDLWIRLNEFRKNHILIFNWIKGHASNSENNKCDKMAVEAIRGKFDRSFNDDNYKKD